MFRLSKRFYNLNYMKRQCMEFGCSFYVCPQKVLMFYEVLLLSKFCRYIIIQVSLTPKKPSRTFLAILYILFNTLNSIR